MKTLLISAGLLTPTVALPPALTQRVLALVLLYLCLRAAAYMRRAAGHAHNLWAADTAITDPEMRRAAAADAHLRAGGR